MNRILTAAALLALTACGAPADGGDFAECELPAVGSPCAMPDSKTAALATIEAAAYCPDGEIEAVDDGDRIAVLCRSASGGAYLVGDVAVGDVAPDRWSVSLEDGSLVWCDGGAVASISRLTVGEIDGEPAIFNVPAADCTDCRFALPACR